jgi:pimeloyl-ACP methyl ester carboxylesterase
VFLPGYKSDMLGSKAEALAAWAERIGQAFLRLDYSGCGESDGAFEDGTLASWLDDSLSVIQAIVKGQLVLVGSSMGGWLMLHQALKLGAQVKGLIGIAAAPDFTDWGFTPAEKERIEKHGRLARPSEYGPEPIVTTRSFWQSGQAMGVLGDEIEIHCPVRLLQGQQDRDVPWETAIKLATQLRSADVQVNLIKDGDHRLSRPQDISLLVQTLDAVLDHI